MRRELFSKARPNSIAFLFLLYWLFIPQGVYAVTGALGIESISKAAYLPIMLSVQFLPPIALYLLLSKGRPKAVFSIAPLGPRNVLYIAVITAAVRVVEFLLEFGLPFVFGQGAMPMPQMAPVWLHLLVSVLLAVVYKELMFRGVLYSEYRNHGVPILKIALVTGLFFGLTHNGLVSIAASGILGVLWVYLLHYTRSIWAPVLSHAIYNGLWQLHPAFHIDSQADYAAFMPTFVLILGIAALAAIPAMFLCLKRFLAENQREKEPPTEESKAFTWSYWGLIAAMVAVIILFRV